MHIRVCCMSVDFENISAGQGCHDRYVLGVSVVDILRARVGLGMRGGE